MAGTVHNQSREPWAKEYMNSGQGTSQSTLYPDGRGHIALHTEKSGDAVFLKSVTLYPDSIVHGHSYGFIRNENEWQQVRHHFIRLVSPLLSYPTSETRLWPSLEHNSCWFGKTKLSIHLPKDIGLTIDHFIKARHPDASDKPIITDQEKIKLEARGESSIGSISIEVIDLSKCVKLKNLWKDGYRLRERPLPDILRIEVGIPASSLHAKMPNASRKKIKDQHRVVSFSYADTLNAMRSALSPLKGVYKFPGTPGNALHDAALVKMLGMNVDEFIGHLIETKTLKESTINQRRREIPKLLNQIKEVAFSEVCTDEAISRQPILEMPWLMPTEANHSQSPALFGTDHNTHSAPPPHQPFAARKERPQP